MTLAYKILINNNLPGPNPMDNYIGVEIYVDGNYETTFTGFLAPDIMREFLAGKGNEIK